MLRQNGCIRYHIHKYPEKGRIRVQAKTTPVLAGVTVGSLCPVCGLRRAGACSMSQFGWGATGVVLCGHGRLTGFAFSRRASPTGQMACGDH